MRDDTDLLSGEEIGGDLIAELVKAVQLLVDKDANIAARNRVRGG